MTQNYCHVISTPGLLSAMLKDKNGCIKKVPVHAFPGVSALTKPPVIGGIPGDFTASSG